MAEKIPSTHSSRLRSASVSSMRSTNVPPDWRATSQLNSAVRALPTWKYPVGDGAKRTRVASEATPGLLVLDERDGARGAPVGSLAHGFGELGTGVLVQSVEEPGIADLEDLGGDAHADGVARALVIVHNDFHGVPPEVRRRCPLYRPGDSGRD